MKKFIAVVMMVSLLMSLSVMAQAELRVNSWRVEEMLGSKTYFVTYESDAGEQHEFKVSEDEFYEAMKDYIAAREIVEEEPEIEAEESKSWIASVGSTITFWNPND